MKDDSSAIVYKQEFTATRLLLTEGADDKEFFKNLCERLRLPKIDIHIYDGKDNLRKALQALYKPSDFSKVTMLGITGDADNHTGEEILQKIIRYLQRANAAGAAYPIPGKMGEFATGTPKVGIFVLPDGENSGELEDLCVQSVNDNPLLMPCVDAYLKCLTKHKDVSQLKKLSKIKLYAWLAAQRVPNFQHLGRAVAQKYIDVDHPAMNKVVEFMKQLAQG